MIHYYYLSLGSNPLSLSLTELPNSSTSPQFKANPSVQSMKMISIVMALLRMITILMILMVAPPPKASSCMVVFTVLELN